MNWLEAERLRAEREEAERKELGEQIAEFEKTYKVSLQKFHRTALGKLKQQPKGKTTELKFTTQKKEGKSVLNVVTVLVVAYADKKFGTVQPVSLA